jgi:hypothetical protein
MARQASKSLACRYAQPFNREDVTRQAGCRLSSQTLGLTKFNMPKLACRCGYVHNLSPIPDDGWVTVLDRDFESVLEAESESGKAPDVSNLLGSLYECPSCNRVMWEKPGEKVFRVYRREE